jgi:hypothetical protein
MTTHAAMAGRTAPLRLVIFDCDGVLVNSEPVANRVVAEMLTAEGWAMTPHEADRRFLGMSFPDMVPVVEAELGRKLSPAWGHDLVAAVMRALATESRAIPGALEALHAVTALGLPWRIASNSSHAEMALKFRCIGVSDLVAGRLHSFEDVARGKPAPDLFLATAAAEGVPPENCVVIEDSSTGARAAAAAGMMCLGFGTGAQADGLRSVGAFPFGSMFDLPTLIAAAT